MLDSNIATVTVTGTITAAPDSGLQATPGDQRVTLNWNAVTGADSYKVYWSDTPGTGTGGTVISNVSPPFYHDGVTNYANYYYVITAVNAVGESSSSVEVSATPVDIALSGLTFTDTSLEACFDALLISTPALVNVHDLTSLSCIASGIADITGIEALTSLTNLVMSDNNITDVSPLAGFTGLTSLNLRNNTITDVSSLVSLSGLGYLNLGSNTLTGVSHLTGLTGLTYLNLRYNTLTDVSPLATLINLTQLNLGNNTLTDVSPLASLIKLTQLHLQSNSIGGKGVGNIDSLTPLTSALVINLSGNIGMSCAELDTLIGILTSPPVDTDFSLATTDMAKDGVNCTNP